MKKIKFRFLTVISVLSIVLTAATKMHKISTTSVYTCRESVDFACLDGNLKRCSNSSIITTQLRNDDYCPPINSIPETLCPGEGLFAIRSIVAGALAPEDYECTTGINEFCCARIISNTAPGTCENTTYPISVEIFCKSAD